MGQELTTRKSVVLDMATRYGMEADTFEATVRATCSPSDRQGVMTLTREEFAAFIVVAKEYGLNPLTREIYAFPKRGGGIVPVVSVDGWINLINSQPQCDGWDMEAEHDDRGELVSYTCSMHRKDRTRPVVITEYLSECKRDTDPWKMKHRMLRHKALIQAGRYAFGFSGIYDEDEAQRIADARDITPEPRRQHRAPPPTIEHAPQENIAPVVETDKPKEPARRAPPPNPTSAAAPAAASATTEPSSGPAQEASATTAASARRAPPPPTAEQKRVEQAFTADKAHVTDLLPPLDAEKLLAEFNEALMAARDEGACDEAWADYIAPNDGDMFPPDLKEAENKLKMRKAALRKGR